MAQLPLEPLDLPPGISRNGTRYQIRGRWYDASQVRWLDGIMQPIGGWMQLTSTPLAHKARGMIAWKTNGGSRYYAVGTPTQLIVGRGDQTTYDITPVGFTAGADDAVEQLGYGGGNYGSSPYGTPRPGGEFLPPMTWTLDTWGDNLVGVAVGDGKVYQWALDTGTVAAVVSGAPTLNTSLLVTDQRHLMVVGAADSGRTMQWSDSENNTVWTPNVNNEAGQIDLVTKGSAMRAVKVKGLILVLTDVDAHVMTYIGQPLIFSRNQVADKCGLIGMNAVAVAGENAYWMSDKRFWIFDGTSVSEVACEVADYVFGKTGMNKAQSAKTYCGTNGAFEEITWFYCSQAATEPDSYVSLNYRTGVWMIGKLARTAWIDKDVFPTPMAVGTDGLIYMHEQGTTANGVTRVGQVYAETSALETGNGERITEVGQLLTDEANLGDTSITFRGRYVPNGPEFIFGPFTAASRGDGYVDVHGVAGRQLVMRVDQATDNAWELGRMRWDAKATSRR